MSSEPTHTYSAESKEKFMESGQEFFDKFRNAETNTNNFQKINAMNTASSTTSVNFNMSNNVFPFYFF